MIQFLTNLKVMDNSGARIVQCIKVLGGHKAKVAKIGDKIVVSIKKAVPKGKIKAGQVDKVLITMTKAPIYRKTGIKINLDQNGAILINEEENPIATRLIGLITREVRNNKKNNKLVTLVKRFI